jgi:tetratricopeptide (TPR) repeat protein
MDRMQPVLAAALDDFKRWAPDAVPSHPIAAMCEPMLVLWERQPDRAFEVFDRYARSEDPWVRAAAPLLQGTFGSMLGRMEWAEASCRESLAAFRALGELWGAAAVLVQLAELAEVRADYPTAIAAMDEAISLAHELGAWGDLAHISGKLAAIRLRMGDLTRARDDLERAEQDERERGASNGDSAVWLGLIRAELHWAEGDAGAARRQCEELLTSLATRQSPWWHGLRALIEARLALIVLLDGEEARCRELLTDALRVATDWVERPAVAAVIDAIAALVQQRGENAELAATLLGIAHSIRGCFDEGSLDAPAVRDAARAELGLAGFEAAYERGRALARDDAIALAVSTVTSPVQGSSAR